MSEPKLIVTLGTVDISEAILSFSSDRGMNKEGLATIVAELAHPSIADADYSHRLAVGAVHEGVSYPIFTGDISGVSLDDNRIVIECANMTPFREFAIGHLQMRNCPIDVIYGLARAAGLAEDEISIQGYADPPVEQFEVVTAVSGIAVDGEIAVCGVRFRPVSTFGLPSACQFFQMDETTAEFAQAPVHALVLVAATRLHDAQTEGLTRIDDALGWLTVRSRYSAAMGLNGVIVPWSRNQMSFRPSRSQLVLVSGRSSGRAWLRSATDLPVLSLDAILDEAPKIEIESPSQRLALRSCRRAASASEFTERISALWEAIEYFVGGARSPKLFASAEIGAIRKVIEEAADVSVLGAEKKQRLADLISNLNNAPLMARFKAKISSEGLPCSEHELAILKQLRDVRNDASHGRAAEDPGRRLINQGVAIVSRILVAAVHRTTDPARH